MITYNTNNQKFSQVTTYENDLEFGWKEGKLVFRNSNMDNIFNQFERWYNVDIKVVNKPNFAWNYTGEFQNQTLQDVLESLSFSQNFEFDITKNTVTIIFKTN